MSVVIHKKKKLIKYLLTMYYFYNINDYIVLYVFIVMCYLLLFQGLVYY